MLLVNNNNFSDRSDFDSYLSEVELLQIQQLDHVKKLRDVSDI